MALLALAACGSERITTGSIAPLPNATSGRVAGAPLGMTATPAADIAGRWMLRSAGGASCVMNFGAPQGAAEGTIAPEGGCPGNFFTSRRWLIEQDALVIRDHNGEPLARLAAAGPMQFDGRSTAGESVSLGR